MIVPGFTRFRATGSRRALASRLPNWCFSPRKGVEAASGHNRPSGRCRWCRSQSYLREAGLIEIIEQLADLAIMFDHAVGVFAETRRPMLGAHMSEIVHPRRVDPREERCFASFALSMNAMAAAKNSASMVSIRFFVSGPVSSIVACRRHLPSCAARPSVQISFGIRGFSDSPRSRALLRR